MKNLIILLTILHFYKDLYPLKKIIINVGQAEIKRPVIFIYTPNKDTKCKNIKTIFQNDMLFSNIFTILPKNLIPQKKDDLNALTLSKVEYFFFLECKNKKIYYKIYHLPHKNPILKDNIKLEYKIRLTAHKLADKIYYQLTGKKGIFTSKIVFVARTNIGGIPYKNLFVCDYDGKNIKQLTNFRTIIVSPAISPNGRYIAYTRFSRTYFGLKLLNNPNLYLYDTLTKKHILISKQMGQNSGAAWSPDGRYIAFTRMGKYDPDIYIYDTKSKTIKPLITGFGLDMEPSFSPDGKRIAFSSSRAGNPELYIYNIEKHSLKRLTYVRHYNSSPVWSPTRDVIAFAGLDNPFGKRNTFDIFLIHLKKMLVERLTIASGNNEDPTWSPDGKHLAFTSTRFYGKPNLFVIHFDGTGEKRIIKRYEVFTPNWGYLKYIK